MERRAKAGTTIQHTQKCSSRRVDDRGYSLADEYDGVAEGGPLGPAMPVAPASTYAKLKLQADDDRKRHTHFSR